MAVKFTNNAATTLAAGINSSVTSIAVTDGSVFPTITGSDHFYVTFDDTTNKEIVKVTARSGNTLTVVRGHDNTTARAFSSGDKAELRIVAALLDDVKTDVSSTLTVDTFTGNGSATAFTLSVAPASEDNLIVFIEGVYQNPGDFTLSGTTLTFDVAPANSRNIIVYHVAALVSGNNLTHNQFTCNGSTTAFTLSLSPIHENNTQVFLDGVYQQKTDYAVSGTTLTMDTAPANGAILEVMTFTQTEVNTLPASFVSGLTEVTAVGADHFMIFDATDSQLKKSLVSDVLESATSISTSADATAITIDSNEKVTFTSDVTTGGHLSVGGNNNELRFYEGANYVGFEAPALSADKIWVLPAADGSNGQVISTDGSGNLSFATVSSGVAGITSSADATAITIDSSERVHIDGGLGFKGNAITSCSGFSGTAGHYYWIMPPGAMEPVYARYSGDNYKSRGKGYFCWFRNYSEIAPSPNTDKTEVNFLHFKFKFHEVMVEDESNNDGNGYYDSAKSYEWAYYSTAQTFDVTPTSGLGNATSHSFTTGNNVRATFGRPGGHGLYDSTASSTCSWGNISVHAAIGSGYSGSCGSFRDIGEIYNTSPLHVSYDISLIMGRPGAGGAASANFQRSPGPFSYWFNF